MATYVLVHGGGHGGWCWQRLTPLLRAAGHEVYTPTLTGLGERAHLLRPDIDLETHIADVVGVLQYEGCTDVVLVGHSYGGMVSPESRTGQQSGSGAWSTWTRRFPRTGSPWSPWPAC
ncbi:alpha/beta fold hydrolase [Streptomyces sp. NBC_01262]|uniref:alpha/beta fold hydrolase n=1 Tax=Streptomyces sp. NBC_01262 TaxID=2903803 RepID=UPI002E36CD69|nr:alpha/beta hydrolase [Streptomyces sp. NBC_01262]